MAEKAAVVDNLIQTLPKECTLTDFVKAVDAKKESLAKTIPDIHEQIDALKLFSEGKMSYSEMRSRCG
jgi:hypothetical protein